MQRLRPSAGFSLIELLVSMAVLLVTLSIVFYFFIDTGRRFKSETAGLDMQLAARIAIDELSRELPQTGYGIDRSSPYNEAAWQKGVIYAGAHAIACNMDIDPAVGPIDGSQSMTFPTGETYTGEGPTATVAGAETYVYSLDADGDGTIDLADRSAFETGSFNPAATTDNPLDFALFRRVYGYDGSAYVKQVDPIVAHLFTNAVSGVAYADSTIPEPLFNYSLTEDLNGNNILDTGECVNDSVDACPPVTTRTPLLYIWGDTNFDGLLSDAEKNQLRGMPVGAVGWSKNRLVESGAYKQTTLASAVNPADADAYILDVAAAGKFIPGVLIQVGAGAGAERFVVESINTSSTPNTVTVTTDPTLAQANGAAVQVVADTLLRAIRAVQINFTAISPRKDSAGGAAPVGQAGRRTAHGMDYRSMTLRKTVELPNQTMAGLVAADTTHGLWGLYPAGFAVLVALIPVF